MEKSNPKAFRDVLDKFIHIGHFYYNGKHHDNVLNIFNDLDKTDQKTLLLGVYFLYSVMETGSFENPSEAELKPKPEVLQEESGYDEKEMAKLRTWFFKVLVIVFVGFVFGLFTVLVWFGQSVEEDPESIGIIFKIISLMM